MAKIEHFALFAQEANALKDFYVGIFGLKVVVANPGPPMGFFLADDGGSVLEIIERPQDCPSQNQRFLCHVAIWVDDYQAKRAEIEALGYEFEVETCVENELFKTAFFTDPGDNRCQIVWRSKPLGS